MIVDLGTRQTLVCPMKKTTAKDLCGQLKKAYAVWGIPQVIQLDGGPPFGSKVLENMCLKFGIKWHVNLPYCPTSSGVVERRMGMLKEQLLTEGNQKDYKGWHLYSNRVLINMNRATSRWLDIKPEQRGSWKPRFKIGEQVWVQFPTAKKKMGQGYNKSDW